MMPHSFSPGSDTERSLHLLYNTPPKRDGGSPLAGPLRGQHPLRAARRICRSGLIRKREKRDT